MIQSGKIQLPTTVNYKSWLSLRYEMKFEFTSFNPLVFLCARSHVITIENILKPFEDTLQLFVYIRLSEQNC